MTGLLVTGAWVAPVHAQDYTNINASGRIVDTTDKPIAAATIVVTSESQGFSRSTTTDASGSFTISQIPAGLYAFEIRAEGYAPYREAGIRLAINNSANVFKLVPTAPAGSIAAEDNNDIVVTGTRTAVADFDRTTTGAVLEVADLAARIPVSRDLASIIRLAPGTGSGDSFFGDATAISGASVAENVFYVNGLNITDFRRGISSVAVPFEFYNTVEVKTGGFQAEFGRATGGVVNAITRSGSNTFHAGIVATYEPDRLRSTSPNTAAEDNDSDTRMIADASIYASGPVIKDRLFFYGLFNPRLEEVGDGRLADRRYDQTRSSDPFFGAKLDAVIAEGHRAEFTYFRGSGTRTTKRYAFDPDNDERGALSSTETRRFGGDNYVGRYTGQIADWLTFSAAYGVNRNREATGSTVADGLAQFGIFDNRNPGGDPNFSPLTLGNPTVDAFTSADKRIFYRADIDVRFEALGSHHVRFGFDREDLSSVQSQAYTGGVAYEYFNSGASGNDFQPLLGMDYVTAHTKIAAGTFTARNQAFYVQDNWSLLNDRVTLQLGLRNDRLTNYNGNKVAYFDAKNQWAPRLGFTVDPFGDRRTKVYGSFGRYYLPVAGENSLLQTGGLLDYTAYFSLLGLNADNSPVIGAPLSFGIATPCPDTGVSNCTQFGDGTARDLPTAIAAGIKPQYLDEFIIGLEQRIGSRWRFGLNYTHRRLGRTVEDFAIDAGVRAYCVRTGTDCGTAYQSGFDQFVLGNPGAPTTITLNQLIDGDVTNRTITLTPADLGLPAPRRTYDAVTLTIDRTFDERWSLSGSYTLAFSKGNTEGGVSSDFSQDVAGYTSAFDQPGLTDGTYGYLPGDRRHTFKVYGSYQVGKWLTLGANVFVQSPRRYGCLGAHPTDLAAQSYGPFSFYCRVNANGNIVTDPNVSDDMVAPLKLTPRGSRIRSNWIKQLDLSFNIKLPVERLDVQLRTDVLNVFNGKSAIELNEFGTDGAGVPRADYGTPTGYQSPRAVRLQLSVRY